MKLSSIFYSIAFIFALFIPTQQSQAFFFDFDFSDNGWDAPYYYSWYQPYYSSGYQPYSWSYYYHNRYNPYRSRWNRPYWNRWNQTYQNQWSEPYCGQCVCTGNAQQSYGSVDDAGLSATETSDIK